MRRWLLLLAFVAAPALAQAPAAPSESDPRIAAIQYDPGRIIRIEVPMGAQTLVELASGEVIQTIGMGNSNLWEVAAGKRGDIFFVRNVSATSATSMSVVTATRIYHFELAPPTGYGGTGLYHVRIKLPPPPDEVDVKAVRARYEYRVSGARSIRPRAVYQKGERTIIEWPAGDALPGIFMAEDGDEALVNGAFEGGRLVVAGTPARLVFRLDRKVATATRKRVRKAVDE